MPTIRNETQTILLLKGSADDGGALRLGPKERREAGKVSDTVRAAESRGLVKVIYDRKRPDGTPEPENAPKAQAPLGKKDS